MNSKDFCDSLSNSLQSGASAHHRFGPARKQSFQNEIIHGRRTCDIPWLDDASFPTTFSPNPETSERTEVANRRGPATTMAFEEAMQPLLHCCQEQKRNLSHLRGKSVRVLEYRYWERVRGPCHIPGLRL